MIVDSDIICRHIVTFTSMYIGLREKLPINEIRDHGQEACSLDASILCIHPSGSSPILDRFMSCDG